MPGEEQNIIGISFGVKGKGAISGDSGARILKQLNEITDAINIKEDRFKIKLGIDKGFFEKQINALAKQINASVSNIKIDSSAVGKSNTSSSVTSQKKEQAELNRLRQEMYQTELKIAKQANQGSAYTNELKEQLKTLKEINPNLQLTEEMRRKIANTGALTVAKQEDKTSAAPVEEEVSIYERIKELTNTTHKEELKLNALRREDVDIYSKQLQIVSELQAKLQQAYQVSDMLSEFNRPGALKAEQVADLESINKKLERELDLTRQVTAARDDDAFKSKERSYIKLTTNIKEWAREHGGVISKNKEIKQQLEHVVKLSKDPFNKESIKATNEQFDKLRKSFELMKGNAASSGALDLSIIQKLREQIEHAFFKNISGALVVLASRALRQVYQNVVALDKAVTDLQIATGKTREETKRLISGYSKLAKQLGATTLEVAKSADTWLRQGYSIEQANKLIVNSMMLSKLGQIDSAEASKALTSAMKGYKVAVEDAMGIVDKFTAVDMEAAVSAGDIAKAMAETAASANIAGISMDRLIGYISTVSEVTQDGAESVGTFYKTLFARMGNVKAGVFTDDITGDALNDVESVLNKLEIRLRDSKGEFRNFGDVLDEVGQKWITFNGVQQKAIATAVAGTRQQEKFIVLMENYGDALKYAETAANSAGTANAKYQDAYLNSIEAKMNALKATWEGFSNNILDSEVLKLFFDATKKVAEFLSNFALLTGDVAITMAISATAVLGLVLAKKKLEAIAEKNAETSKKEIDLLKEEILKNKEAASSEEALALAKKRHADAAKKAAVAMGAYIAATILLTVATNALNDKSNESKQRFAAIAAGITLAVSALLIGLKLAGKAIKGFMISNPAGWVMLAISALVVLASAIKNLVPSVENLTEAARKSKNAWKETADEIDDLNSRLKATADRIAELKAITKDKITLVEKEELDNLDKLQKKLESEQAVLKAREEERRKIAEQDAIKASDKVKRNGVEWWKWLVTVGTGGASDSFFDFGAVAAARERSGEKKEWWDWIPSWAFIGSAVAHREGQNSEQEIVDKIIERWKVDPKAISDEQKNIVLTFIEKLEEQTDALEYNEATADMFDELYKYYDTISLISSPNGFETVWNRVMSSEQFEGASDELKKIANELANTEDVAARIQKILDDPESYKNAEIVSLLDYFIEFGIIADKDTESLKTFVEQVKTLRDIDLYWVDDLSYASIINEMQGGFDALSKALEDIEKIGVVSASNMKDVLDAYPNISDYFKETGQGFVLKENLSELEILEKYISDSMQTYVKQLELTQGQIAQYGGLSILQKEIEKLNLSWEEAGGMIEQYAIEHNLRSEEVLSMLKSEEKARKNLSKAMTAGAIQLRAKAIEQETEAWNKQKDALKGQLDKYKSIIDIRKDLLKSYEDEIDYQKQLAQKQKSVIDLETQLALARLDTSALGRAKTRELESQLATAKEDLDDFSLSHAVDVLTKQLENEYGEYEKLIHDETERIVDAINNLANTLKLDTSKFLPQAYRSALESEEAKASNLETQIDELSKKENLTEDDKKMLEALQNALDEAYKLIELLKKEIDVNEYHVGGVVGGVKSNEEFAKLLKGETVVTPMQARVFMSRTLPNIVSGGSYSKASNFNAPLIKIEIASVAKDSVSDVEKIVNKAVTRVKEFFEVEAQMSNAKYDVDSFVRR